MNGNQLLLAVTGATGMIYLPSLLHLLREQRVEVHGIISEAGCQVMQLELGVAPEELAGVARWYGLREFTAPAASGSSRYAAMIVLPCTTGTLGAVACGYSGNLIHRAADVMLKERKPLLLAVREAPLNRTHLRNMLALHEAGAIIYPLMPSFYMQPADLQEMADHLAARICNQLGIDVPDQKRWEGLD